MKMKRFLKLALSSCMAVGLVGAAGMAFYRHSEKAYADTNYIASMDEVLETGLKVTNGQAKFNVTNYTGQYILKVTITASSVQQHAYFYDMTATVGGQTVNLAYTGVGTTGQIGYFTGIINVTPTAEVILNTSSEEELTVNVELLDLYIGQGNDYILSGFTLPANTDVVIKLDKVTEGKYEVLLDYGATKVENANISAIIDNIETPFTSDSYYFSAYSCEINVKANSTTLTLKNNGEEDITVRGTLSLTPIAEQEKLPEKATLTVYSPVTYSYTSDATGYYSISVTNADGTAADVSVMFITDLVEYDATTVEGVNYPIYMEATRPYYFELTLLSSTAQDETATVNIAITKWNAPTVDAEKDSVYYLPVTGTTTKTESAGLKLTEGTVYDLTLFVPYEFYFNDVTVTANIGDRKVLLDAENNYSARITATNADSIYLTSDSANNYTTGISFVEYVEKKTFKLGEEFNVTVPAGKSVSYYLDIADRGYYTVTLSANNDITVSTNLQENIITAGQTEGSFVLKYYTYDLELVFTNGGETDATFDVTCTRTYDTIPLTERTQLTVAATKTEAYMMEALAAGRYKMTFTDLTEGAKLSVTVDGVAIEITDGVAEFTVSETQDNEGLIAIAFTNSGETDLTFYVTVAPTAYIELGENLILTIPQQGENYYLYTGYYFEDLAAGSYLVTVELTNENQQVMVNVNGIYALSFGCYAGTFTLDEDENLLPVRITAYGAADATTFTLKITELTSTNMTMGTAQTVALTAGSTNVYSMNLGAGSYRMTASELVEGMYIYAENNLVYFDEETKAGTFYASGNIYVIVVYKGTDDASVTITVTPENVIELGTPMDLFLASYFTSTTYYANLSEGSYKLTITYTDGSGVGVAVNGTTLTATDNVYTFTVEASGYVQITFSYGEEAGSASFSVLISAVTD